MQERREPRIGALEAPPAADRIPVPTGLAEATAPTEATIAAIADRILERIGPVLREAIAESLTESSAAGANRKP